MKQLEILFTQKPNLYKIYTAGDKYSKHKECTVPRVGYYWGLFYSEWRRIQIHSLPTSGGTGSAGYENYKNYYDEPEPYAHCGQALSNYKIICGDFNSLEELENSEPPNLDRQLMLDYGVSELWVDEVK